MSLSNEHVVYCLSKERGWVQTLLKYDGQDEIEIAQDPVDTLLKIKFTDLWTFPSNESKYSDVLSSSGTDQEIAAAKEKFGELPKHPFI